MSTRTKELMISDVRVALDMNRVDTSLFAESDEDTLKLDELIESKIADGVRFVYRHAPLQLLGTGTKLGNATVKLYKANGEEETSEKPTSLCKGVLEMPADFLRLIHLKMSDWAYGVSEGISADDPRYAVQHSRYGIKGSPERPVIAIIDRIGTVETGSLKTIELFTTQSKTIDCSYLKDVDVDGEDVDTSFSGMSDDAWRMSVYYIAYLTALSLGDDNVAQRMLASYAAVSNLEE